MFNIIGIKYHVVLKTKRCTQRVILDKFGSINTITYPFGMLKPVHVYVAARFDLFNKEHSFSSKKSIILIASSL